MLDRDVSGKYELLESCPGAMGSLHKRVSGGDGSPLFFFLDPGATTKGCAALAGHPAPIEGCAATDLPRSRAISQQPRRIRLRDVV